MPRLPRSGDSNDVLHLISRGVEKRPIYTDDADRRVFLAFMRDSFRKAEVRLFSYCLMNNHFHLLAAGTRDPIGVAMHHLLTRYAHYFNQRHERVGHLFQNRFHSIVCLDLAYFVTLTVYINLNPVRAGVVKTPDKWPWSSHQEIVEGVGEYLELGALPDIVGIDRKVLQESYQERIRTPHPDVSSLAALIREAAALVGLRTDELTAGGKGNAYTIARRFVLHHGFEAGYTVKEMAAALNCTGPALSQLWKSKVS